MATRWRSSVGGSLFNGERRAGTNSTRDSENFMAAASTVRRWPK